MSSGLEESGVLTDERVAEVEETDGVEPLVDRKTESEPSEDLL